MRRNKNDSVDRFGFDDDADEELWATRDYFWALKARLLDGHGAQMWRSFRAGYAGQRSGWQGDYGPPSDPVRRAHGFVRAGDDCVSW